MYILNIYTIFGFFLIPLSTSVLCERSFTKLELIKNFFRSTMRREKQRNLAILSIETELSKEIKLGEITDKFSETKNRKMCYKYSSCWLWFEIFEYIKMKYLLLVLKTKNKGDKVSALTCILLSFMQSFLILTFFFLWKGGVY